MDPKHFSSQRNLSNEIELVKIEDKSPANIKQKPFSEAIEVYNAEKAPKSGGRARSKASNIYRSADGQDYVVEDPHHLSPFNINDESKNIT
jgi:hypothetical protein